MASGNWSNTSTWQVRSSGAWINASSVPGYSEVVSIQSSHTITIDINSSVGDLWLNSSGIVACGDNTLSVNGTIRSYTGTTETTAIDATLTTGTNPGPGNITCNSNGRFRFVGNTRNITVTGAWGANGLTTSAIIDFALNGGQTGTLNTAFKANTIIITSGTVDMGGFRLAPDNGSTAGGTLTINGGTLLSSQSGASSGSQVVSRTAGGRCGSVTINSNGTLKLTGGTPCIDANSITNNGTVEFAGTNQSLLAKSTQDSSSSVNIDAYNNLTISGSGTKTSVANLTTTINGTLSMQGTSTFALGSSATLGYGAAGTLELAGTSSQSTGSSPTYWPNSSGPINLIINNSNGVTLDATRTINGTLSLIKGSFSNGSNLTLGTGATVIRTSGSIASAPTFGTSVNVTFNQHTSLITSGNEIPVSSTVLSNLVINSSNGVTLGSAATVNGTLTLTLGKLTTTASNLLSTSNTSTGAVSRTSGYIDGPIALTLPASLASGSTYLFPLGKSAYTPFELINPTTNSGGTVVIKAEVFETSTGGSAGTGVSTISSSRYWDVSVSSGGANFTNTSVRVTESVIGTYNRIGNNATIITGSYNSVSNAAPSGNSITTSTLTTLGYFVFGELIPTITEIFLPQYMQGSSGTNNNRLPHAFRITLGNLLPGSTYRYFNSAVLGSDVSSSNGAGNPIIVIASGSTFTRLTSPDLNSSYGSLTTDGSGNYTGWFMLEPTADTRFATSNNLFMRIMLNNGNSGTTVVSRATSTNSASVIDLNIGNTANDGTAIRGSSYTSDKNFAVLYDNADGSSGSSRPIAATVVENDAVDNSTSNGYASFYNSNVNAVSKQWGTIIPNVNANGIKRVEYRNLTDGSMNYWFSDVDGNWNGTANTVNPNSGTTEIVIPYNYTDSCTFRTNTTISGDQTIGGNNNIADGVIVTISPGATLTINGKVSGTGTGFFRGSNTSSILIGGTGANGGILRMDQTTTGSTNRLQNLTLNRGSSPSNGGVDLGNTLELTGTLTLSNGTLTTGGNLTLVSNGSGTARIATIPSSADISGTVISQRFVPAVARRYRMFSPNTSSFTFSDLVDDMFITGPGGATNGFDATPSNSNTAYTYQESTSGGRGWKGVPSISTSLSAGQGALVFVRGDRTLSTPQWYTTGSFPSQNAVNVDFNGALNKGTISPSITFTSTTDTSADGWNLVGNPYASQIDWSTISKSGLDGNFWTLDPSTGSYYGNNTGVIASGQAFFVHAISASPVITFYESDKVSGAPANFFKTGNPKIIARMVKDSLTTDLTELEFVAGSSKNYIPTEDIIKMYNSSMNFGITSSNNFDVQKNAIPPVLTVSDTVRLFAFAPAGQYTLNFTGASSLSSSYSIYLMDMFTSTTQDLRTNPNYTFSITSNSASSGYNRFRLIFVNPSALPVKLVDFYAEKDVNRGSVQLHWRTSSENNSSRFVIERSADNTTEFNEIGVVGAKGNSTGEISYQFDDIDILKANHDIIYYRLKQIDKDGSSQQSQIVSVRTVNQPPTEDVVYPNPATSIISIRRASEIQGNVHVDIYDIVGKLNVSKDIFVTTGQDMTIDVSILETGVYIIRYSLLNSGAQNFIKFEKK